MTAIATANPNVLLNQEQRLYVLKHGDGYSCLGYDVVDNYIAEFLARLGDASKVLAPAPKQAGTLEHYEYYQELLKVYAKTGDKKTWFDAGTPEAVQRLLERLRKDGTLVRMFYGDPETGRDSLEEWDTVGVVGRTGGIMRTPILVPEGEDGGFVISSRRLLKVVDVRTGKVLYQHKKYHLPALDICPTPDSEPHHKDYPFTGTVDGKSFARFKSKVKACNWVAFISGEHHQVPN